MAARTVLVTGAARHLGAALTRILAAEPSVGRVIAVDVVPPRDRLGGAEFVRADIRNPVIARVIRDARVDTVVHMGVIATPRQAGGRAAMKEINVIGTMQLLAACQKSDTVERLVVKSTASVYGAGPRDPALFTEEMSPAHPPTSGWAKDSVEVEGYVRGFARRRPETVVSILRFANVIGPRIETAMTSYFALPLVPRVLGFDARLQFVHEDDCLRALHAGALRDDSPRGAVALNVAGEGVLALSQAVRRTGRASVAVPAALLGVVGRSTGRTGLADFSAEQVRFLTYGRAIDTTRIERQWGFLPERSTEEAFADFIAARRPGPALPDPLAAAAGRLAAAVGGR